MRFAYDQNGDRVFIDDADRGETYYCPECGEKMVQRHGEILAHCFAHFPNTQCTDTWHYDETDWHIAFQSLFPKENQEIVLEYEGKKHRADVLFEERKTVIEIQGERLNRDEFQKRNEFFRALGYKVIWVFDQTRIFENDSINYGYRRMACRRNWERPSKVFQDFVPHQADGVEVWFQRSESDFDDQPRFFQVLSSFNSLKTMECGFCHSLKELMKYLKDGRRIPDYSQIYDIKYAVCRTDKTKSLFFCPKNPSSAFFEIDACNDCPFKVHLDRRGDPYSIGCAYRFEHMDWDCEGSIADISRREDGLVESITVANADGEANRIEIKNPKTFLRSLIELWDRYKPLKYIIAYNVKNERIYSVFNPGWQKYKKGTIKGKMRDCFGRFAKGEDEVPNAEEPVWIVVSFVRPEENG